MLGKEGIERLSSSRVAVFGIGGVGGYAAEALARSGVGALDLIDSDKICPSNINRQIIATINTLGKYKVDAAAHRLREINPDIRLKTYKTFYCPETEGEFDFGKYDYIIDAIDTVTGKIALVINADKTNTPIISSMGAGNKLDPTAFEVADIYETSVCPLAKVMRRELRRAGIRKLKVVYSKEKPIKPLMISEGGQNSRPNSEDVARPKPVPGSVAFVPSVAGLIIGGEVVKDLINSKTNSSDSNQPLPTHIPEE